MASLNPAKFIREVRQEVSKISWPTRKETSMFTLMVFVLVTIAAVFFLFIDWAIAGLVGLIIGI